MNRNHNFLLLVLLLLCNKSNAFISKADSIYEYQLAIKLINYSNINKLACNDSITLKSDLKIYSLKESINSLLTYVHEGVHTFNSINSDMNFPPLLVLPSDQQARAGQITQVVPHVSAAHQEQPIELPPQIGVVSDYVIVRGSL